MGEQNVSLKKNFFMNAILAMSSFIFPLVTFPYVSRILFETGTGKVELALSVVNYFNMFAYLGIPTYGIRACASVRNDKEKLSRTVHELMTINMVMAVLVYIVFLIALNAMPRLYNEKLLYIVISSNIFLFAISLEWMYKALEKYSYITKRSIAFKALAMVCMFLLIHKESDYVIYGAITVLASSASYILNLINARKYIYMHPLGGYNFRQHMKPIMVFFAMSCATTIYTNLDNVMLGFMTNDAEVGFYGAAVRIKTVLVTIVTSLGTVVLPRASYYIKNKMMKEFRAVTEKALNFVCLFSFPLALYFMFFAKEGIFFLASERYARSILSMQVIMPTLVFIGMSNIMGIQILVPLGREKTVFWSEVAGAITDLIINAVLIPRMGGVGAAIGTLTAEIVVTLWQYVALKDEITEAYRKVNFRNIAIALLIASVCSIWVKLLHLGNFVTLLISAVLFFAVYGGVLAFFKESLVLEVEQQILAKIRR